MSQVLFKTANAILQRLEPADLEALSLRQVSLPLREPLELANTRNEFVYFVESGLASVVAENTPGGETEIGLVGSEGMTGLGILYDDPQTPFETFMQIEGTALCCETAMLHSLWKNSETLRVAVARYARAFSVQCSSTAIVNGRFTLEQRLARWLLMVGDRMGPEFNITHEFIAVMLAVRRSGVTLAVQSLEGMRLIRATRGHIEIVSREGLLKHAAGSYGLPEREYDRLWNEAP